MDVGLSYDAVGATDPDRVVWAATPRGYRRWEATARIGAGAELWERARREVLAWGIKRRSGFTVSGGERHVREGVDHLLTARLGPIRVHEPVLVVAVTDRVDRCGFAYGTRPGHPVSGEEAFIVHRDGDGSVWLTLRSLTRPARGAWRLAFPVLLLAQRHYRRRYFAALRDQPDG